MTWRPGWPPPARTGALVVVDDAHRLAPEVLRALAAAARSGVRVLVARRPTIAGPELADLDEAAAAGGVEWLGPLDRDEVGALVAAVTGRPMSPEVAATVHERRRACRESRRRWPRPHPGRRRRCWRGCSGGSRCCRGRSGRWRGCSRCGSTCPTTCWPPRRTCRPMNWPALRTLRDEGMLVPGGERMIPAVAATPCSVSCPRPNAAACTTRWPRALTAAGADPLVTAAQLRAARVRTPAAAEVYRQAGELTRFTDPTAALAWFDDATDAGADPSAVAAGRAEAGALLGPAAGRGPARPPGRRPGSPAWPVRSRPTTAARTGPPTYCSPLGRCWPCRFWSAPAGWTRRGRPPVTRTASGGARFAEAVLAAAGDPDAAVPLLIEAAEVVERATPAAVLPDTPHAVGAVVAVLAGDVAAAEYLLDRADRAGIGGPAAGGTAPAAAGVGPDACRPLRHRPRRAGPAGAELPGRERLLRASIAAGIARRRGDIAGLRAVWGGVEPVLARRAVDLWQLEAVEELLVAAARLRQAGGSSRSSAVLDAPSTSWAPAGLAAALGWLRVQVAMAADDPDTVTAQARRLTEVKAGHRALAQCAAAALWAQVLAGSPAPPEAVLAATEQLVAAQLPWEASRLAGQAAIHATDPVVGRRLLERARELSEPDAPARHQPGGPVGCPNASSPSPSWCSPAAPTGRSAPSSTSRRRPSSTTSRASGASSAPARGLSCWRCSARSSLTKRDPGCGRFPRTPTRTTPSHRSTP